MVVLSFWGHHTQEERNDVTKVPFLGDLPLFGNLFKSTGRTNNKTELLIFYYTKGSIDRQYRDTIAKPFVFSLIFEFNLEDRCYMTKLFRIFCGHDA